MYSHSTVLDTFVWYKQEAEAFLQKMSKDHYKRSIRNLVHSGNTLLLCHCGDKIEAEFHIRGGKELWHITQPCTEYIFKNNSLLLHRMLLQPATLFLSVTITGGIFIWQRPLAKRSQRGRYRKSHTAHYKGSEKEGGREKKKRTTFHHYV